MPILLDTPYRYSPGHGEPEGEYPEVKVRRLAIETIAKEAQVITQYGTTTKSGWIASPAPERTFIFKVCPPNMGGEVMPGHILYKDLVAAKTAKEGSLVYDEVADGLYKLLQANVDEYAGVIK